MRCCLSEAVAFSSFQVVIVKSVKYLIFGSMERSNDELCASVLAHELVIDAVRRVVEKGQLPPSDEEHVMLCLHPTAIDANEIAFLSQDVEDGLRVLAAPPEKREIPTLRSLVEKELNETFSLIDRLDAASGFTRKRDQLTEHDILSKISTVQECSTSLAPELDKLYKRGKIVSQLTKDSLDPVVNSASALKTEILQNISEISQLETSILNAKFKDVSDEVLDRLLNDLEEEVNLGGLENDDAVEESTEDLAAAALELKTVNEEIAMKRAYLEALFPSCEPVIRK